MGLLAKVTPGEALVQVLTNWSFWSAIISTIFIVMMAWFFTKKSILKQEWNKVIINLVLIIGLPCLAFNGFMADATIESVKTEVAVLIVGFLYYIIFGIIVKFIFIKYERDVSDTLMMCTLLASTTFFGIPVVTNLWPGQDPINSANLSAQIFNVPYRIFLYSLGFIVISRPTVAKVVSQKTNTEIVAENKSVVVEGNQLKLIAHQQKISNLKANLKQILLNPILLATFIGLIFWITQLIPGIDVVPNQIHAKLADGKMHGAFSPLRLDNTFPPFFKITSILANICTPLALIAIGMTLSSGKLKEVIKDKRIWFGLLIKIVAAPLVTLALGCVFAAIGKSTGAWSMNVVSLGVMVIMIATPPANVAVSFTIKYQKQPVLASNLMMLSTLFAIIALPIWVIIVEVVGATSIFN